MNFKCDYLFYRKKIGSCLVKLFIFIKHLSFVK